MSLLYADTSAVVRSYLPDEPDHDELATLLFDSEHRVITSELTRVEFASALAKARNAGRIRCSRPALARFDADARSGALTLVPLVPQIVLPAAYRIAADNHSLRTLDAIHLAVAMHDAHGLTGGEPVTFITRDQRQAEAGEAHGLEVG